MKKLTVIFCLFCITGVLKAQLTGTVFLDGQSNHTGIKVKFIPNSGTAVGDSTFTNANGNFSINISGGLYNVVFSKSGYQSFFYNNNTSVVLTNTMTLSTATLFPGNTQPVSGNVSGTWNSGTIYVVNGNLTILAGTTLNIQPGTTIKFNGGYTLTVKGTLNALGTSNSNIVFTSNKPTPTSSDWAGILFDFGKGQIDNCVIEYCQTPIYLNESSPTITNNEIRKFKWTGISLEGGSSSLIKNNSIHGFNDYEYSFGISTYASSATIECNTIYDGLGRGISVGDACIIKNNHIYSITNQARGYGIECYAFCSSRIENNIIHDCVHSGIVSGESVQPGPKPEIINNTLYNNHFGIAFENFYSNGKVVNNIIFNNTVGIIQAYQQSNCTPSVVAHNLLWNNPNGDFQYVQINGIGQIVNTNSNGDPIDSYYNVSKDPLFVNNTPPFYSSNSPCINAGDNNYSSNIGCNMAQACAASIVGLQSNENSEKLMVYPNPFSDNLKIKGETAISLSRAVFYDIGGKAIPASVRKDGESITITNSDLAPGIYFLRLELNSSPVYLRVVKQ